MSRSTQLSQFPIENLFHIYLCGSTAITPELMFITFFSKWQRQVVETFSYHVRKSLLSRVYRVLNIRFVLGSWRQHPINSRRMLNLCVKSLDPVQWNILLWIQATLRVHSPWSVFREVNVIHLSLCSGIKREISYSRTCLMYIWGPFNSTHVSDR